MNHFVLPPACGRNYKSKKKAPAGFESTENLEYTNVTHQSTLDRLG